MNGDRWAPLAGEFVDHYDSLYGQVRIHVLQQHLLAHLPPPPARLVDVGGGAGHQSLPLAHRGYDITLLDPSPAMLAKAEAALRAEPREVATRVRLVHGTGEAAADVLDADDFDGVLCHAVLPYVEDPVPLIAALAQITRPGGVVSLVVKNGNALAVQPALDGDWAGALAAFDTRRIVNALGLETRGDTVQELSQQLDGAGIDLVAWYGVRLFSEGWGRHAGRFDGSPGPGEPVDDVLAVELEASRRDPYRQLSRLLHLVGVRRETGGRWTS